MCIVFSKLLERLEVAGTKIFVAPDVDGRQLTVYENLVALPSKTAAAKAKREKDKNRPTIGDVVSVQDRDDPAEKPRKGKIVEDGKDAQPYKVQFDDDGSTSLWLFERDAKLLSQAEANKVKDEPDEVGGPPKNAMILPVPAGRVQVLDLSKHKTIFKSLADAFPKEEKPAPRSAPRSWGAAPAKETLVVKEIGDYLVSVAPRLEDLGKIDPEHFTVVPGVVDLLGKHYAEFSFVVCRFKDCVTEGSPIGYIHERTADSRLFVPTRHSHGGEEEAAGEADWDHIIFTGNTEQVGDCTSGAAFDFGDNPAVRLAALQAQEAKGEIYGVTPAPLSPQDAITQTQLHTVAQLATCDEALRQRNIYRGKEDLPNEDMFCTLLKSVVEILAAPARKSERTAAVEEMVKIWLHTKEATPTDKVATACCSVS